MSSQEDVWWQVIGQSNCMSPQPGFALWTITSYIQEQTRESEQLLASISEILSEVPKHPLIKWSNQQIPGTLVNTVCGAVVRLSPDLTPEALLHVLQLLLAKHRDGKLFPVLGLNLTGIEVSAECIRKLCKTAAAAGAHSQLRDVCLKQTGVTGDCFRELFPLHMKLRRLDLSHNVSLNLSGYAGALSLLLNHAEQLELLFIDHTGLTENDISKLCNVLSSPAACPQLRCLRVGPPAPIAQNVAAQFSGHGTDQLMIMMGRRTMIEVFEVWGLATLPTNSSLSWWIMEDKQGMRGSRLPAGSHCKALLPSQHIPVPDTLLDLPEEDESATGNHLGLEPAAFQVPTGQDDNLGPSILYNEGAEQVYRGQGSGLSIARQRHAQQNPTDDPHVPRQVRLGHGIANTSTAHLGNSGPYGQGIAKDSRHKRHQQGRTARAGQAILTLDAEDFPHSHRSGGAGSRTDTVRGRGGGRWAADELQYHSIEHDLEKEFPDEIVPSLDAGINYAEGGGLMRRNARSRGPTRRRTGASLPTDEEAINVGSDEAQPPDMYPDFSPGPSPIAVPFGGTPSPSPSPNAQAILESAEDVGGFVVSDDLSWEQQQRGCDPLEVEDEQSGGADKVEKSRREKRRTKTARDELADLASFPNESSRVKEMHPARGLFAPPAGPRRATRARQPEPKSMPNDSLQAARRGLSSSNGSLNEASASGDESSSSEASPPGGSKNSGQRGRLPRIARVLQDSEDLDMDIHAPATHSPQELQALPQEDPSSMPHLPQPALSLPGIDDHLSGMVAVEDAVQNSLSREAMARIPAMEQLCQAHSPGLNGSPMSPARHPSLEVERGADATTFRQPGLQQLSHSPMAMDATVMAANESNQAMGSIMAAGMKRVSKEVERLTTAWKGDKMAAKHPPNPDKLGIGAREGKRVRKAPTRFEPEGGGRSVSPSWHEGRMGFSSPEPKWPKQSRSHDCAASSMPSDSEDDRPIAGLGKKPRSETADSAAAGSHLQQNTEAAIPQSCEDCQQTRGISRPGQQMDTSEGLSNPHYGDDMVAAASASTDLKEEGLWAEQHTERGNELSAFDAASLAEGTAWPSPQQLPEKEQHSTPMRMTSNPKCPAESSGAQQPHSSMIQLPSLDMRCSAEVGVIVPDKAPQPAGSCILLRDGDGEQVLAEACDVSITHGYSQAQQVLRLPAVIPDSDDDEEEHLE